ncbi:MAG: hypothetical protein GXO97_03930 [Nitrospirae bacterium]|nr:hypothetical protein [Nitrospirota bacterium]
MGRILLIPPKLNLIIEFLADLLYNGDPDYSDNIVVFPGRRPAHFLRKELARRVKKGFVPPRIFSMDDFIDYLYEKELGIKDKKISSLDALAILYEIHRNSTSPLGGERFLKIEDFIGIGSRLFRDLEECLIEDIKAASLGSVDISAFDKGFFETENKIQTFSSIYREFYEELRTHGLSTRSMRYRQVSESDLNLEGEKGIILSGFLLLTETEKRIFKKLLDHPATTIIFQNVEAIKEQLRMFDSVEVIEHADDDTEADISIYKSPDNHGQIFVLAERIKELKESNRVDERTVIVMPGVELLMPMLHYCLSMLDDREYNISMGYPLFRTPIFAFYESLIEVINSAVDNRIYVPSYIKFVLHPYTKNIYFTYGGKKREDITRILFHFIEEELRERGIVFALLEDIEELIDNIFKGDNEESELSSINRDRLREHLRNIHSHTILKFMEFTDVADLAKKSSEVLMYIYHNSTASHHAFFYPFSEGFLKAFDELESSLFRTVRFDSTAGYFNFFKKYIKTYTVPFEGTPLRGIQVLGFLETRNIRFDRVYFLNLNEGIIPEGKKEDSLIPQKIREILGLSTYKKRDILTGAYFDLLIKGAKEVHLFYVENDKTEKSRFIEKLIWEKEKQIGVVDSDRFVRPIRYEIKLDNRVPSSIRKSEEIINALREFQFSATSLDDYIKCPVRFYYRYVLQLSEKDEITPDPDRRDIGIIVHQILGEFFKPLSGITLKEEHLDTNRIHEIVDRVFERHYGREITGAFYLIKRQVKKRMADLINHYYRTMIKRGMEIQTIATEKLFNMELHGFRLKGVIDRIEMRRLPGDEERIMLIDYKIASSENHLKIRFNNLKGNDRKTWSDSIGSIQIPFYMLLCEGIFDIPVEGHYLLLGKGRLDEKAELKVINTQEEFYIMKDIIRKLLEEVFDPEMDFFPTTDMRKNCPECLYQDICGTQWIKGYTY